MPTPRPRLSETTPELDAAELRWWERHAEVEERFCWVQPLRIRTLLRSHYVRRIVNAVPPGGRVLEVGCGTGWFSLLLAQAGAGEVHGFDSSSAQIERARRDLAGSGLEGRVQFHTTGGADLADLQELAPFNTVVVHGVLHHLSEVELRDLMRTLRSLAPEAGFFAVEPVWLGEGKPTRWTGMLARIIDRLVLLPRLGQRSGLRRVSAGEAAAQAVVDGRGDSPKETPFLRGEMERLLSSDVTISRTTPVLLFSYLVAKNLLLMELSYPRVVPAVLVPYLSLIRAFEGLILARLRGPFPLPVFMMYEGRLAGAPTLIRKIE